MNRYLFTFLVIISIFIQSCVDFRPFRVGDNIDNDWKISNLSATKKALNIAAEYLCYNDKAMENIAVGYFVGLDSDDTYEGELLAYDFQDSLMNKCKLKTYTLNTLDYVDNSNYMKLVKKPDKKYEYLVYGIYRYRNKGYDLSIVIYNLNKMEVVKVLRERIMIHNAKIEINTLHIPQEIELR